MPGGMRTWDAREHVKVIAGGIWYNRFRYQMECQIKLFQDRIAEHQKVSVHIPNKISAQ